MTAAYHIKHLKKNAVRRVMIHLYLNLRVIYVKLVVYVENQLRKLVILGAPSLFVPPHIKRLPPIIADRRPLHEKIAEILLDFFFCINAGFDIVLIESPKR